MTTFHRLFWIVTFCAAMTATSCGETTTDDDVNNNGGFIIPEDPTKPEEPDNSPSVRKISTVKYSNGHTTRMAIRYIVSPMDGRDMMTDLSPQYHIPASSSMMANKIFV